MMYDIQRKYGISINAHVMKCPSCEGNRIVKIKTSDDSDSISKFCAICWEWFDLEENQMPCHSCHYFTNHKTYWNKEGHLDRMEPCDECWKYNNFKNYKPQNDMEKCDECEKEVQLYFIPNMTNKHNKPLAVCLECKNIIYNVVTKEEYEDLLKRINVIEKKLKDVQSIIYCDNCGKKINLNKL